MSVNKYSPALRGLHWLMALLFAVILVLGVVMVAFKQTEPWALYDLHKSLGVLVFGLLLLRLGLRLRQGGPAPPPEIPILYYRIAGLVVILLYLGMILLPLSGYALSNTHGYEVKFFGLPLPGLFPAAEEWEAFTSALHFYLGYGFMGVIGLHLAGVIWHHLRGEEILRRIT